MRLALAAWLLGGCGRLRFESNAGSQDGDAARTDASADTGGAANFVFATSTKNFAIRSASHTDLLAYLRGLGLGPVEGEFANGHPRATGGSVPPHEFARILKAMGFPAASAELQQ